MDHQFVSKIKHLPFLRIIMVTYVPKLCKFFQFGKHISASQYVIISKISLKKMQDLNFLRTLIRMHLSNKSSFYITTLCHHQRIVRWIFLNICIAVFSSSTFTCKFKRLSNKAALFSAYWAPRVFMIDICNVQ